MKDQAFRRATSCSRSGDLCILTYASEDYLPLTENCARSAERAGVKGFAVVTDSSAASSRLSGRGISAVQLTSVLRTVKGFQPNDSQDFKWLTRNKLFVVCLYLMGGFDVLFADGNIVFLSAPQPYIDRQKHFVFSLDIGSPEELRGGRLPSRCTGLFYARSCGITVLFLLLVIASMSLVEDRTFNDQRATNALLRFLERMKRTGLDYQRLLRVDVLDIFRFPNGVVFREHRETCLKNKPVAIHANWLVGMDSKVDFLKQNGLWFAG